MTNLNLEHPPCFSSFDEWADWLKLAARTRLDPSEYCRDCTPSYQRTMIRESRCNNPDTFFFWDVRETEKGIAAEMIGLAAANDPDGSENHRVQFQRLRRRGLVVEHRADATNVLRAYLAKRGKTLDDVNAMT